MPTAQARYASIVIDADSGEVLQSANPDSRNFPASLTKMMTLYLVFDQLEQGKMRLGDRLAVSKRASAQAPSKLGLRPGQTIGVEDAILALCTKSANDAAVVLAEAVGGTEIGFAKMMTDRARQLGMRQTVFRNASGLPNPGQVSSARDMAKLGRALVRTHARYYHYFSTRQFTWGEDVINSHNRLMLNYPGADGIKTGYIHASGFNLVASAKRDGRRLIGVVFGGTTAAGRDRRMADLLDEGFAAPHGAATQTVDAAETPDPEPIADAADDEPADTPAKPAKATPHFHAYNSGAVMKVLAQAKASRALHATRKGRKDADAGPAAAPAPAIDAAAAASGPAWAVQVGAFSRADRARAAAEDAAVHLGPLADDSQVAVVAFTGASGATFYRARLVGLSEIAARASCRTVKSDCQVIQPDGSALVADARR